METNDSVEEIIKEYEGRFMNNGVNGVMDDTFQDPRTVLTRAFIREALTTHNQSLHTSLVAAVEEIKEFMAVASSPEFEMGYQIAIKDYEDRVLTIINRIFKE